MRLLWVLAVLIISDVRALHLINLDLTLALTLSNNTIKLILSKNNAEKLVGTFEETADLTLPDSCEGASKCYLQGRDVSLEISSIADGFNITWLSNDKKSVFRDCFNLNKESLRWFGGPERFNSQWPIENLVISSDQAYRSSRLESGAIAERYWLNSRGGYIFVHDKTPLFVDQNGIKKDTVCFSAAIDKSYILRDRVFFSYVLIAKGDAKEAHLHAVGNFLGKPTGRPNEKIIRYPIWTTWAKYKRGISDETVRSFANEITSRGFTGQLEIDDKWEVCYGSLTLDDVKFAQINSTVQSLKQVGFTVSLWVHPFVNDDCKETTRHGRQNGYFVKSTTGNDLTSWWNGNKSRHIDFTNKNARDWFVERLKVLQTKHGIDSFKFDAGENDWAPEVPLLTGDVELVPNILTSCYVQTCAAFGDLVEVRSGWRSQSLPVFVRMIDKDSRWGLDNGLHSLITTLLQMNLNGYTLILPDMIGGNGYGNDTVTPELLVRWTQANIFMPAMQFSYVPWEITSEEFDVVEIVRNSVALHEQFTDEILKAINASITDGIPVNPPIWWLDPTYEHALKVNDEYLLGETILVAPIIMQGAVSRDIVLPAGLWKDGNNDKIYKGRQIIKNYAAPIEILPYFIKQ